MADEADSMMSSDKMMTDHYNLAFNPYAISTDDLTLDNDLKNDKSMENNGYLSETFVGNNPHYEDTLEVAKKAGLTGTGPRKKENIVYEETIIDKKNKDRTPKLRASNLPPRPTEEWTGVPKNTHLQWKLPFVILCLLVLLCIAAGSLGVLAYFDDKKCSCEAPTVEKLEAVTQAELLQKMNDLETKLNKTKSEQEAQLQSHVSNLKKEINELKSTVSNMTKEINELEGVKSNVSEIKQEIDKFNDNVRSLSNFSQQLSSTVESINSTLTIKLRNVSKQIGPRGYNGSQGPPGPGNLSSCVVGQEPNDQKLATPPSLTKAQAVHKERTGWKVMAATCSTSEGFGAQQTALSVTDNNTRYVCTCAGVSQNDIFKPGSGVDKIECIIIYWECPIIT